MKQEQRNYEKYKQVLSEELVPAMGCTEPIALAYAAATARELLGEIPTSGCILVSGSIIKNTKSVIVPNTGHQKGIATAVAAGILAGNAEKKLQVLADITTEQQKQIQDFSRTFSLAIEPLDLGSVFDIIIELQGKNGESKVRIKDYHTNIVYMEKNREVLLDKQEQQNKDTMTDRSFMSLEGIWEFITTVKLVDIEELLLPQIKANWEIAQEGLRYSYGANIGKLLLKRDPSSVQNRACAMAAAGSDARMDGCELPVVINSGSGNQGMTASLPVIVYAQELNVPQEKLLRALALSNLVSIHEKKGIGRLSAFCGAVCAGAGAGAGIAYLLDGTFDAVTHTISNTLAIISGMICDGAKPSCAAKIAASVASALLGYDMYQQEQQFYAGDGILGEDIEKTIENVGRVARDGMRETNQEIIRIMTA